MSEPVIVYPFDLVDGEPFFHDKGKCRWCGGKFVLVYQRQWLCQNPPCATRQVAHAIEWPDEYDGQLRDGTESPWYWLPTPAQVELCEAQTKNVLFGGAAGGSKSFGLRHHIYKWCQLVPGYQALLIRRTFPELETTHIKKMAEECHVFGAKMVGDRKRNMQWENQSFVQTGHCQDSKDMERYLSTEYDEIVIDESSTIGEDQISEISSRARSESTRVLVRERGGGWVRLGSNPGGVSHVYLSDFYITKAPDPELYPRYHAEHYQLIRATLEDNPYQEPDYEETRLDPLKEDRRKQLAEGDWSTVNGQFFRRFDPAIHVRAIEAA